MTKTWKNNKDDLAIELTVEETGIVLKVNNEEKTKHGKEIEELQTLNMYPPKDENKVFGTVSDDGQWTTYEMVPGKNWEFAKKDIVATMNFWMSGLV
jgi:hypothetical protein